MSQMESPTSYAVKAHTELRRENWDLRLENKRLKPLVYGAIDAA